MEFLINNWILIFIGIVLIIYIIKKVKEFIKLSPEAQIKKMKSMLYDLVVKAEKEIEYGHNQEKFNAVYEGIIKEFPWVEYLLTKETFNGFIDEALEEMEKLLGEE